jgi:purine-nucleoside phosphorylase
MKSLVEIKQEVDSAVSAFRARTELSPKCAVILGSGAGQLASSLSDMVRIPFTDIPGFVKPTASGHAGVVDAGLLSGVPVVVQRGRMHLYEGLSAYQVAFPVRVYRAMGAEILITVNAAGSLQEKTQPGSVIILEDFIQLSGDNPLIGVETDPPDARFLNMMSPTDAELNFAAHEIAVDLGMRTSYGVLAFSLGPRYETKAEIHFYKSLGADAIAMSTIPEITLAKFLGIRALALSLISNLTEGRERVTHEEVLAAMEAVAPKLDTLIQRVIKRIWP